MTAVIEDAVALEINEWGTLNTAAPSTKLPSGHTPNADNTWVDEKPGSVITANGYLKVGTLPSNLPPTLCLTFFKTSDGTQTFVVSDNATVWSTKDFVTFTSLITGLSSPFQLRAKVIRDKVWFTNGSDAVRTWDGTTVVLLDGSAGAPTAPKGRYIEYFHERVWLYHIVGNRSQAAFSALADSTGAAIAPDSANAWPSSNTLQISEGDNDFGTGLKYYSGKLYAFKQYSIYRIDGYDEYSYTRLRTRASTGCRFAESVQELDGVLKFIGVDGFYEFNGEETQRISDPIDPADTTLGTFGFKDLQQPFLNNNFWTNSVTADFAAGTVPRVLTTASDKVTMTPADDSQTDFSAGSLTDVDVSSLPGYLQLAFSSSGASRIATSGKTVRAYGNTGFFTGASPSNLTDGSLSTYFGFSATGIFFVGDIPTLDFRVVIDLNESVFLATIILRKISSSSTGIAHLYVNTGSYDATGVGGGTWTSVGAPTISNSTSDLTLSFAATYCSQIMFRMTGGPFDVTLYEIEGYHPSYKTSGKFVSRAIDYTLAPANFGRLTADIVTNDETATFFTQSSADSVTWDAEVTVVNEALIGSTARRYLRWGVYLISDGTNTPIVNSVYVGGTFISAKFDTGGSVYAWGAYEVNQNVNGQTINHYYRTATTSLLLDAAAWTSVSPGAALTANVANRFIQFRLEMTNSDPARVPEVLDVTINWIKSNGTSVQTLQNVASIVWHNRYWLSAAKRGSSYDNVVIIRGKKSSNSPWQRKPWNILSYCIYQGNLYGGSSTDGSIYRLDYGYSLTGSAMDCYFETGDFTKSGFVLEVLEIDVEVERTGPYDLSVGISTDKGTTYTEKSVDLTSVVNSPSSYIKKLLFNILSDEFRLRVRTDGIDEPFQVHSVVVWYRVTPARGSI